MDVLAITLFSLPLGVLLVHLRRLKMVPPWLSSLGFLLAQVGLIYACSYGSGRGLTFVVLLLASFIACVRWARHTGTRTYRLLAGLLFFAYIVYWAMAKYALPLFIRTSPGEVAGWADWVQVVGQALAISGISYIGFKLVHFAVDLRAGMISDAGALEFVSWLLFFPTIVAGPMQRFEAWREQWRDPRVSLASIAEGTRRMIIGMFMKFVLAELIYGFSLVKLSDVSLVSMPAWRLCLAAGVYSVYLYWDFSGYSHMAIGAAKFWGIDLPENFNWPFIARNLAEFWRRWHITLSTILRDYLFYPMSIWCKRRPWLRQHSALAAFLPPFVTFVLAGVWHGATLGFLLYGIAHGVGLGALAVMLRHRPRTAFARWWSTSKAGHVGGSIMTFVYVSFAAALFGLSSDRLAILFHRVAGAL